MREGFAGFAVAMLCALLGTAIAYSIAAGFDVSTAQMHVIAFTSLAGGLLAITLSPVSYLTGRNLTAAAAIVLAYALILAIPGIRHGLGLMAPHPNGVLLSAIGAAIAMSSFTAARRLRSGDEAEAEPEHAGLRRAPVRGERRVSAEGATR